MATLEQLLDVETETEGVFRAYLATIVTAATSYASDSNTELPTPRIGVVSTLIEQGRHQITIPTGTYANRPVYDQFRIRLDLSLVYDPSYSQGQASLRGKLRVALTAYSALQSAFNNNAYLILAPDTLRQVDGSREIDDENKQETINTTVEGMFFLNPVTLNTLS